ncbi:Diaminopimelate epimerase-like protein [Cylindrobasidium torrendii FP15055 ss-10]|uniref:Diaminopimelate epimerase-like protein n=1 Tax=Cylindrobasidium torrendii FP15055 ss-10 TaxID=1314674 RepID=A0A0D7B3A6_9AGAR|nr:Diaminopimelate epimerase-like protein [Cylindrobasidium torrendii FP15055 ss-10]
MAPKSFPYYQVSAFTADPLAGNPAAIAFIDRELAQDYDRLLNLSGTLNQPMGVFVYPSATPSNDPKVARFGVRFVSPMGETKLCGHGTLAASGVMFERGVVPPEVEVIEFETYLAGTIHGRRKDNGWYEIQLEAAELADVTEDERAKIISTLGAAFGREVKVNALKKGTQTHAAYLLIELDVNEDLHGSKVKAEAFDGTGFSINVVTTDSPDGSEAFVSRMFSPNLLGVTGGEDHVCGSAHCLLVPYWYAKKELSGIVDATQVSARGGNLKVSLQDGRTSLQGQTATFIGGNLFA